MDRINKVKKIIKGITIFLLAVFAILVAFFIVHIIRINSFNEEKKHITPESTTTEAVVDIHPRGQTTDSWEKQDTGMGMVLNAKIYEMIITNNSGTLMENWDIKVNIHEDCYLNNGWCGTFEVHQFNDNGEELVQTIDLRNYKSSELIIRYVIAGQDLLIPLKAGDYFIYHPDRSGVSGEAPIKGTSEFSGDVVCGLILYSRSGAVDLTDYEFTYTLYKSLWSGKSGTFFAISFSLWAFTMIILFVVFIISVRYEEKFLSQSRLLADVFKVCCTLSDSRDFYSGGHSGRVADYSRMIAEKMGMDKSDCDIVYNAALLHNIGNNYISEQILRKNGKLTGEEYSMVKAHTTKGADVLRDIENIPHAREAALYHHERYDGSGYPEGKKENDIPLIARIVAVADAYDAMNNDRPYRKKLMREQIREEFIKSRGTQFDPMIVSAFLDMLGEKEL